jgi:hypothetical protein
LAEKLVGVCLLRCLRLNHGALICRLALHICHHQLAQLHQLFRLVFGNLVSDLDSLHSPYGRLALTL